MRVMTTSELRRSTGTLIGGDGRISAFHNQPQQHAPTNAKRSRWRVVDRVEAGRKKVQDQIDQQLRKLYKDVLNQALPDRHIELIKKLDTAEGPQEGGTKHASALPGRSRLRIY